MKRGIRFIPIFILVLTLTFASNNDKLIFQPRVTLEKIREQTGIEDIGSEIKNTTEKNTIKKNNEAAKKSVYISPSGKRYHKVECRHAQNASSISIEDAEKKGYTPCRVCKP